MLQANDFWAAVTLLEFRHPELIKELKMKQWTLVHLVAAFGTSDRLLELCIECPQAYYALTTDGLTPLLVSLQHNNTPTSATLLWFHDVYLCRSSGFLNIRRPE